MIDAKQIKEAIDAYCVKTYGSSTGFKTRLGLATLGRECSREIWYKFRWVKAEFVDARMLRLFNRGHREEARFIEWLRGIGWEVNDITNNGQQHRVSIVMDHAASFLDGIGRPQELLHAIEDDADAYLLEFKTSRTGSKFNDVVKKGVKRAKPEHWAQMCVTGYLRKLKRALYLIINKNDDGFHAEIVELDWNYGAELERKAEGIIFCPTPPHRISQSASFHVCKLCHFQGVCFDGEQPEKNCRSCQHARPIEDAQWRCNKFDQTIHKDFIKSGCDEWSSITS